MQSIINKIFSYNANINANDSSTKHIGNNNSHFANHSTSKLIKTQQLQTRSVTIVSDSKILQNAITAHNNEDIEECLNSGRYGVNQREEKNNNTACHLAVLANNKDAIKIFRGYGANINELNAQGDSPLMLAIKKQADIEMLKCLLANNAEINQLNYDGHSALTFAIQLRNKELIKELITRGAVVNLQDNANFTALFHAVKSEDLEIIEFMLSKCDNVNHPDNLGQTVLHLATKTTNNTEEIIKLLVKNHANINARDNNGQTPMHYAYKFHNIDAIAYLLNIGADINATDNLNSTVIHLLAKSEYNQEYIKLLDTIAELKIDVNIFDAENNTPLFYAIKNKNFIFINKLLELHANIFIEDSEGYSYLDLILVELNNQINTLPDSLKQTNDNIINQTLLACLINIEILWQGQHHHATSIVFSVINNNLNNLLAWIYNEFSGYSDFKFDPSKQDDTGFCPIHIAIELNKLDAIKILLDNNADVNAKDKNGRAAMHHATQYKKNSVANTQLINLLIAKKADVNAIDLFGNTALFYTYQNKDLLAIKTLLEAGADIELQNDDSKKNLELVLKTIEHALRECKQKINDDTNKIINNLIIDILNHLAKSNIQPSLMFSVIEYDCYNVLKKITELAGTKQIKINFEQTDAQGNTLIHKVTYKLDEEMAKLLIAKGINLNIKNNDGMTALHYAAKSLCGERFAKLLLDFCAKVDVKDHQNRTALHYATQTSNLATIDVLMENKANIDSLDADEKTPLHYAVIHGSREAMELLVKHGANIYLTDNSGNNSFHWAIMLGFKDAIKFLCKQAPKELSTVNDKGKNHLKKLIKLL